jgi:hypothetical protein
MPSVVVATPKGLPFPGSWIQRVLTSSTYLDKTTSIDGCQTYPGIPTSCEPKLFLRNLYKKMSTCVARERGSNKFGVLCLLIHPRKIAAHGVQRLTRYAPVA